MLLSTFIIDHFDLFGLKQVWLNLRQKEYTSSGFKVTFFYKFVRHPLYVGWIMAFWGTPRMTLVYLVINSVTYKFSRILRTCYARCGGNSLD